MTQHDAHIAPRIRRLWTSDQLRLLEHFQRLDRETRRLRFGGEVSEGFVQNYATKVLSAEAVVFGTFPDGTLRGVAELRGLFERRPQSADVALLVEPAWQEAGLGEALLSRLIAAAQNRGVKTLHMQCLQENVRMWKLAKKHHARLDLDSGSVDATLVPRWPTPMSVIEEAFGDPRSQFDAIFHPARNTVQGPPHRSQTVP